MASDCDPSRAVPVAVRPRSIQELNALPRESSQPLYLCLIPPPLLAELRIDPVTLCGPSGDRLVQITSPEDKPWARVEVRASADDRDPILLVDVEMSPLAVPELAFVQVADPTAPRFGIDRDPDGLDTLYGTRSRNVGEELRAMHAGLAPGQVRRGLRMLGSVLQAMERFCERIGTQIFLIEPLFYHSAILYEGRGCGYLMGRELMEDLHAAFASGAFAERLDGASPFRPSAAAGTVRGRSWALHDGVSGQPWGGVKMYKATGRNVGGGTTFPGALY